MRKGRSSQICVLAYTGRSDRRNVKMRVSRSGDQGPSSTDHEDSDVKQWLCMQEQLDLPENSVPETFLASVMMRAVW